MFQIHKALTTTKQFITEGVKFILFNKKSIVKIGLTFCPNLGVYFQATSFSDISKELFQVNNLIMFPHVKMHL